MPQPSEMKTVAIRRLDPITSIAEKATIPPEKAPWFSRMKGTERIHDPKATVSYIVARDGETQPNAGFEARIAQEGSRRLHGGHRAAGPISPDSRAGAGRHGDCVPRPRSAARPAGRCEGDSVFASVVELGGRRWTAGCGRRLPRRPALVPV